MAYATIAGLTVEIGLYVALMPMLVYALLGTSRPLSVSSTSTIAILTAHQLALVVGDKSPAEMAAAAANAGAFDRCFPRAGRRARLGFVANFISDPVLTASKAASG
jgi:MFS superfamily sulfate permease-like transporter